MYVQAWHWFSIDQVLAASFFAREASSLEQAAAAPAAGSEWEAIVRRHRSVVTASILASAAFQETVINEVIGAAAHPNLEGSGQLPEADRRKLTDLGQELDRISTLSRYQMVLHLLDREPFDRGAQLFQDADLLVALRNALLHYKPRWRPGAGSGLSEMSLDKRLAQRQFPLSPLFPDVNPFFPDRCLSFGCANWAVRSAIRFANEFHTRLSIEPVYAFLGDNLNTLS